jgi:putative ABC transport system substrate-binding protein
MRRRAFITFLGGAVSAWPFLVRAQSSVLPVVTLINARSAAMASVLIAEFRKGLGQTGIKEGRDVAVEYHWLDGHYENLHEIIGDAVRRGVAVIATPAGTPTSLAAKAATSAIPETPGSAGQPRQCHDRRGNHEGPERSGSGSWPSIAFL